MATIKASVTKVQRNPKNKEGAIVTLSNGQVLWLQISYITKVLEGAFMDDCRPTALQGSTLTYEMKKHEVGDLVFDAKGNVKAGETVKYSTAGERPINLNVEEVGGFINEYDKAQMNANAVAKLSLKGAFAGVFKKAATPEGEPQPALQTVKPEEVA